jgi:hypothetical protein
MAQHTLRTVKYDVGITKNRKGDTVHNNNNNFTLGQATKAHRGSGGIAMLFL